MPVNLACGFARRKAAHEHLFIAPSAGGEPAVSNSRSGSATELNSYGDGNLMKRLIASAVALSVIAAPAVAATAKAPANNTKQVKKSSKLASNAKPASPTKKK
jgi:hypothetical protein